jgi:hypothetical protein
LADGTKQTFKWSFICPEQTIFNQVCQVKCFCIWFPLTSIMNITSTGEYDLHFPHRRHPLFRGRVFLQPEPEFRRHPFHHRQGLSGTTSFLTFSMIPSASL